MMISRSISLCIEASGLVMGREVGEVRCEGGALRRRSHIISLAHCNARFLSRLYLPGNR